MTRTEVLPATANPEQKPPFFHNIDRVILQLLDQNRNQAPVYMYSVDNVYVSPYGALYKNGRVISQSLYKPDSSKLLSNFFSFQKKIIRGKVRQISGDCVVFSHSWYQNYYHWMIEIMPRLFSLRNILAGKKLILHKQISKFHAEVLGKFDPSEIVFAEDDELIKCERAIFASFPNFYTNQFIKSGGEKIKIIELNLNVSLLREMTKWFLDKNPLVGRPSGTPKNIYISRKKAGHRKILNEQELEELLKQNNFTKVFAEDFAFDEQQNLLFNSEKVLAVHGAGLTNIMFMKPGSVVIDLISEHHHEFCYMTLANAAGVNYAHINCKGNRKDNPAYNDIYVDLKRLEQVLSGL